MAAETAAAPELIELTHRYQKDLPADFFTDLVGVASDLAVARRPPVSRPLEAEAVAESTEAAKGWSIRLREAILEEIFLLLCTDDPKYQDVREAGKALSKPGVTAIAGGLKRRICRGPDRPSYGRRGLPRAPGRQGRRQ